MSEEELKQLIEKYYDGISTDEDEKALRAYFSGNNVLRDMRLKRKFSACIWNHMPFRSPRQILRPRIMRAVDARSGQARYGKMRTLLLPLLSAAAGLLILAGSYFFFVQKSEQEDTFSDPRIAYAETMKSPYGSVIPD